MNLDNAIQYLFPNAVNGKDYVLQDDSDGKGPYVKEWTLLDPEPSMAELQAVEAQAEAAIQDKKKEAELNTPAIKALIEVLENRFSMAPGELRQRVKDRIAE